MIQDSIPLAVIAAFLDASRSGFSTRSSELGPFPAHGRIVAERPEGEAASE